MKGPTHVNLERGIKRSIYVRDITHGKDLNSVSEGAFALHYRITATVDDYGCCSADPDLIRAESAPRAVYATRERIASQLEELQSKGLVEIYEHAGERYLRLVGFSQGQRNGRRIQRFPLPPNAICQDAQDEVHPKKSGCNDGEKETQDSPKGASNGLDAPGNRLAVRLGEAGRSHDGDGDGDGDGNHSHAHRRLRTPQAAERAIEIYEAYPRKVEKKAALKAIAKALQEITRRGKEEDPAAWLLSRVTEFAASPAGQSGKYTPYPSKWFNKGQFDDDPKEWACDGQSAGSSAQPSVARVRAGKPKYGDSKLKYVGPNGGHEPADPACASSEEGPPQAGGVASA